MKIEITNDEAFMVFCCLAGSRCLLDMAHDSLRITANIINPENQELISRINDLKERFLKVARTKFDQIDQGAADSKDELKILKFYEKQMKKKGDN